MSCGRNNFAGTSDFENCVCDVVRDIVAAQDEVANANNGNSCRTSCERSIDQLLSPTTAVNGNGNTTIPFILYCKGDCDPFIGTGVLQEPRTGGGFNFDCIETPIFRARRFVNDTECCVKLELLVPVNAGGQTPGPGGDTVCDFFTGQSIRNLRATGLCITVDLDCFCGIACLDPITPLVPVA